MSTDDGSADSTGEYAVGYGRPPVATRFQPGKSGNSRGRPKGVKSIGKVLEEALSRRVTTTENGRSRRRRVQDVIIFGVANDAARRDLPSLKLLFWLIDRYGGGEERNIDLAALAAEDRAIIEQYLASMAPGPSEGVAEHATRGSPGPDERRDPAPDGEH
jgi:Family of unknown function (DUF5681)